MIVDERIVTFINSLETENSEILEAVEQEALSTYVPIIRKEMQFPESASDDTKTYVHPGSRDRSRFLCVIDE